MTPATLADWTTPRPFAMPDLGPGIGPEQREGLKTALQAIAADPTVQALVLFGSRWHVISEAARHGQVLVVRP